MLLIIYDIGSVFGDNFKMIRNYLEIITAENVYYLETDPVTELKILWVIITNLFNVYGYSTLVSCCVGKSAPSKICCREMGLMKDTGSKASVSTSIFKSLTDKAVQLVLWQSIELFLSTDLWQIPVIVLDHNNKIKYDL